MHYVRLVCVDDNCGWWHQCRQDEIEVLRCEECAGNVLVFDYSGLNKNANHRTRSLPELSGEDE